MREHRRLLTTALCVLLILGVCSQKASANDLPGSTIRVGVSGKTTPLIYTEGSQVCGAFADMMSYIASSIGSDIEYVIYMQPAQALSALEENEIDVVLGATDVSIVDRTSLELTRELYAADMCVVSVNSTIREESSSYATYEKGTIDEGIIALPTAYSYYVLPNQDAVMDYLIGGYTDRIYALWDCVSYRLEKEGLSKAFTVSSGNLSSVGYAIAVKRSNILLMSKISSSITSLRNDNDYGKILSKYNIQTPIEAGKLQATKLLKIISFVVSGAALTVLAFTLISMRLRSLVRQKTAELSEKIDDLEHSSNLRNALVERSSAGSMVLRLDGSILLMNDAMRRLAGFPKDSVISNISELGFIERIWEHAPAEMKQPELFTERDADGLVHTYRYQNHRSANHDERVFIVEDITREEAEKQEAFEEDKNRALNRIIAGLAHEIKNPLTTLKAYAYLAQSPDDDPEFYDSFSKYVPGEINRISSLVESLVNYSRPVRGQKERVRVADISDSCLGLAYVTSKNKITITNDLDRSLFIRINPDQLRQALVNIFLNSIDSVEEAKAAGKENCAITHSVFRRGDMVVIEVHDTGMGMSEEQLKSCTDPFFTTKKSGTGMGLALTKQYIKENDGTLEIESQEGEFTTMRMVFTEDKENE